MGDLDFILIILLVASFAANFLALSAFTTSHSLRSTANRFVINMIIANLAICTLLLPCAVFNKIDDSNSSNMEAVNRSETGLYAYDVLTTNLLQWGSDVSASWGSFAVLLVVTDTWCAVTDPLRYHSRVNAPRAFCAIVSGWVVSAVWAGLSCASLILQNAIFTVSYCITYTCIVVFLPFILLSAMYWRIFCEARNNGMRMRRNGSSPLLQSALNLSPENVEKSYCMKAFLIHPAPILNKDGIRKNNSCKDLTMINNETRKKLLRHSRSTPDLRSNSMPGRETNEFMSNLSPLIVSHRSTNQVSCMTNLRHRLSNASSVFRDREESRAARISILVVFMFLGTYVPHAALTLIRAGCGKFDKIVPPLSSRYSACFILLASLASPILFAYRNRKVRRGVRVLLGVDSKTNANRKANNYKITSSRVSNSSNYSKFLVPPLQMCGMDTHVHDYAKPKRSIIKKICFSSKNLGSKCADVESC